MRNIWILRTNAGGAYCTQYFIHANRMQNVVCDNKPACRTCSLFATSQIKFRVAHIKVFAVKFFLNQAEAFTETLEMHDLALAQKMKIGDNISLALEFTGIKRNTAGCLRPDPGRVIDIVRSETGGLKFFST